MFAPGPTPATRSLPTSGKAGRNMPAAVASAVVMLALVIVGVFWWRPLFDAFVALLILGALWELAGAFARVGLYAQMPPLYLGAIGMIVGGAFGSLTWVAIALYLTFFAIVLWRFFFAGLIANQGSKPIYDVVISAFMAVYVPFTASFVIVMSQQTVDTPWPLIFFVVIVVCSDIGGWLAGVTFGKHPMAPKISPKKTWEGFAGSIILSALAAFGGTYLLNIDWWWTIPLCAVGALVGTLGDLTESLIKREVGLKDMSEIVPGHGGLMDRLDALLFTAPLFYVIYAVAL